MISSTATFFDGKSSIPLTILVEFDERSGLIQFSPSIEGKTNYMLDELTIEQIGDFIYLQFDQNGSIFLKTNSIEIKEGINSYNIRHNKLTVYQKLINVGFKIHILIAVGILGLITLAYFFVIPWVGEKSVILIPRSFDQEIGEQVYQNYVSFYTIDSIKTKKLNAFASQLNLENEIPITITVVNNSQINAFALPNGEIVIFTGILEQMENYEELVGLISHEVAHINKRHSMKMLARNVSGYIFISAIFSDVNGIMAIISDNANNLQSLSYSRRFEREADSEGFRLMVSNHVNPDGMVWLFQRLQKEDQLVPEFISTHPMTEKRIVEIKRMKGLYKYGIKESSSLENLFQQIKEN